MSVWQSALQITLTRTCVRGGGSGGVRGWVVLLADAIAPLTSPAFGGATMISSSRRSLTPKATIALQVIGSAILAEQRSGEGAASELGRGRFLRKAPSKAAIAAHMCLRFRCPAQGSTQFAGGAQAGRPAGRAMLRSVAFEGVVLQVPSNVEVGVESGELTLSFSNFSGDVSVPPKKRKSPDEQETEQGGKRIALSQAAGSDFVFPNGGRSPFKNGGQGGSQASSSAGDAPEPRALAWDELRDTTSPNGGQPEPGAGSGFSPNGGQPEPGGSGSAPAAASRTSRAAASTPPPPPPPPPAAFDAAKTDDEDDDDDDAPAGGGVGDGWARRRRWGTRRRRWARTPWRTRCRRRPPARRRRPPSAPPPPPPPRRRRLRSPRASGRRRPARCVDEGEAEGRGAAAAVGALGGRPRRHDARLRRRRPRRRRRRRARRPLPVRRRGAEVEEVRRRAAAAVVAHGGARRRRDEREGDARVRRRRAEGEGRAAGALDDGVVRPRVRRVVRGRRPRPPADGARRPLGRPPPRARRRPEARRLRRRRLVEPPLRRAGAPRAPHRRRLVVAARAHRRQAAVPARIPHVHRARRRPPPPLRRQRRREVVQEARTSSTSRR